MNAVLQSSDLLEWLSKLVSTTSSISDTMNLRGLVHLQVENGQAVLRMCGAGLWARFVVPAKIEQPGQAVFSVRPIQMVAQGARQTITVAGHNGNIVLTSNGIQVYAPTIPDLEFPEWRPMESDRQVIVTEDDVVAYQMSIDITRNPSSSDTLWVGRAELGELYVSASCRSHVMCLFGEADREAIPVMASELQRAGIQAGDILTIGDQWLEIQRSSITFRVAVLQAFEPDRHDQVGRIIQSEISRIRMNEREILKLKDFLKVIVSGSDDKEYAPIGLSYESGHLFIVAKTKDYESHCAVAATLVSGQPTWKAGLSSMILLEAASYNMPTLELAAIGTERGVDAICAWFGQKLLIRAALRSNFPDPDLPAEARVRLVGPCRVENPHPKQDDFEEEPA